MRTDKNVELRLILVVMMYMTIFLQGCVSLQVPSADGKPKLIGFGNTKTINCRKGQVYQLTTSGISIRLDSTAPGLSIGWHQTRLFFPSNIVPSILTNRTIAIENKCIGANFSPLSFMLGYDSSFAISRPSDDCSVIQYISYSSQNPTNTVIEQKEIK